MGPRALALLIPLAAAALLLSLAPASAAGEEALVERPTPFDVPLTYPEPDAFVADAAPGSNGTAHYLVATRFSWYYIRANTTTGESLEVLNLTRLGFQQGDYYVSSTDAIWRTASVHLIAGRVVMTQALSQAVVNIVIFDEGDSATAVNLKQLLPAPVSATAYATLGVAVAENATNSSRPSVVWSRLVYSYPYTYPTYATEVGAIPLDLSTRSAAPPATVATVYNFTGYGYSVGSSGSPLFDTFRLAANNRPIAAAVGSASGFWITLYGLEYYCRLPTTSGCGSWGTNLTWIALSASAETHFLDRRGLSEYASGYGSYVARLGAVPAADGSVAVSLTLSTGFAPSRVSWARIGSSPGPVNNTTLPASIFTASELTAGPSGISLTFATLANGTGWPVSTVYRATGWPAAVSVTPQGTIERPLDNLRLITSSPLVVAGGTQNRWTTWRGGLDSAKMPNVTYAEAWPVIARVQSGSITLTPVTGWQALGPAAVRSVAVATLDNGSRVGAIVAAENGTGVVRLFTATGTPLAFVLHGPLAGIDGEAVAVKAVPLGSQSIIVIQVVRPFLSVAYYSSQRYQDFFWLTADASGPTSPIRPLPSSSFATYSYYYTYGFTWTLSVSEGNGLLFNGLGLFILDPRTGHVDYRISLGDPSSYPYSANATKFLGSNETIMAPNLYEAISSCSSPYYALFCYHSVVWWSDGEDLYAGFVLSNHSMSGSDYYCGCVPKLRVVHWMPDDTVRWAETTLVTGAANDSLYYTPLADLSLVASGDPATLIVSVRHPNLWERVYRVNYSLASESVGAPTLIRENPAPSATYLKDHVGSSDNFAAVVRTDESGTFYSYPYAIGMEELFSANATSTRTLLFSNVTVQCIWYYYYYPYYGYDYGCPRWTPTTWGNDFAVLVVDMGRARFFSVNHPPTAPELVAPADGAVLTDPAVHFRVTASSDPDRDPLVYRFDIFDELGNRVFRVERSAPSLDLSLADGRYRWTCSVSDGVVRVDCVGNFTFAVDATPPVADAGGPYSVHPGEGVLIDGTGSSDAAGIASYAWTIGAGPGQVTSAAAWFNLTWDEVAALMGGSSSVVVTLTVVDGSGNSARAGTFIVLIDDPIEIDIAVLTASPAEGSDVRLAVNFTWGTLSFAWDDPDANLSKFTLVWKLPFGQGAQGAQAQFFASDSGALEVTVTAVALAGGHGSATATVVVRNLDPTASGSGPTRLKEGQEAPVGVAAGDPSPVDAASLSVAWSSEGGVEVRGTGTNVTVRATANGPAVVRATVTDKDGGRTVVEFPIVVEETADPASGLWVPSVGPDWVELRWTPTPETDFVRYEVTVFNASGGLVRTQRLEGLARDAHQEILDGLVPSTRYRFELVVVAKGGAVSPPTEASATTAPPDVVAPPPSEQPPGGTPPGTNPPGNGGEPPLPSVTTPGVVPTISTEGAGAPLVWLLALVLAAMAAVLYWRRVRPGRPV